MRFLITSALLLLLTVSTAGADEQKNDQKGAEPSATEINWMKYDEGLAAAKENGKHILANFTTGWCGFCKKMNKTTFVDPAIVAAINKDFVAVKIDGDSRDTLDIDGYKITERDLAKAVYRVGGYPTYWFLESDGTKLGALRGYQSSAQLAQALKIVSERQYEKPPTEDQKADSSGQ
ncbi:MAG TPA: thioredoxin family protein [candidate division Zixibacteria bacterium]|nr:thioredoxin family protein [candidate division Zixibacteria bacterium]